MPSVEFEPTIPVFERAKIFHTLDRAATVLGVDITTVVRLNDTREPINLVLIVTLITCILELLGLSSGLDIDYFDSGFSWVSLFHPVSTKLVYKN
jgi:hypothetical protein